MAEGEQSAPVDVNGIETLALTACISISCP